MHRHGRICRAYGLSFIAQKFDAAARKDLRRLFGDGDIARNQNPLRTGGFHQNGSGILRRYISVFLCS